MNKTLIWICIVLIVLTIGIGNTYAQGTAFTYQGKLTEAGSPANGTFDLTFRLFDTLSGGAPIGSDLERPDVSVAGGIFTVLLDFDASPFDSNAGNYLEISVRPGASTGAYITLSPRQPITSSPYATKAVHADSAATADTATNFTGNLSGDVTGTQKSTAVTRLQNRFLADTAPTNGQMLTWNGTSSQWEPGNLPPTLFLLWIRRDGSGVGEILSTPSGISCGAFCVNQFNPGAVVQLTATAAPFSTFTGWSGACGGTGTCTVTMDQIQNLTATFVKPLFSLSVTRTGNGTVAGQPVGIYCGAACTADFESGTQVTLSPVPDPGFIFLGWTGACSGPSPTCSISVDGNKSVHATFGSGPSNLQVAKQLSGGAEGTVTSSPAGINCESDCSQGYANGTNVTLTAVPNSRSIFTGWSGGGCGGNAFTCTVILNADTAVTTGFAPANLGIGLSVIGGGSGTVTSAPSGINCGTNGTICSAQFSNGSSMALTATPNSGSVFVRWTVLGNQICHNSSDPTCLFTLVAPQFISAEFAPSLGIAQRERT